MRAATLFISGVLVGYLCGQLRPPRPAETSFEIDEMATPSIFRRTTKLQYRPVSPVSKGVAPTTA